MDKDPSDAPHSNESDYFEGATDEMDTYLASIQHDFMEILSTRSDIIDGIIDKPEDESLLLDIKEAHESYVKTFEKYIQTLFMVPMDDKTRRDYIKTAFIDADYSQRALNQIVHGRILSYDTDELDKNLEELLTYKDGETERDIVQKFREEFGEDIINFLGIVNTEDSKFLASNNRRENLNNLEDELDDQALVRAVDALYKAQYNRLATAEAFDSDQQEISEMYQHMVKTFDDCVDIILRLPMDESDRTHLITGLFIVTDKNQNDYFTDKKEETIRSVDQFEKLREKIERACNKKTSLEKKKGHLVWLYEKEFTDDLTILLDRFGEMDS